MRNFVFDCQVLVLLFRFFVFLLDKLGLASRVNLPAALKHVNCFFVTLQYKGSLAGCSPQFDVVVSLALNTYCFTSLRLN